jgi:hypothetical protein
MRTSPDAELGNVARVPRAIAGVGAVVVVPSAHKVPAGIANTPMHQHLVASDIVHVVPCSDKPNDQAASWKGETSLQGVLQLVVPNNGVP